MGWSYTHAKYYKNGKVDRKKECDELYTWESGGKKVSVVKSRMVGTDYFAAIKVEENGAETIDCVLCLTAGQDRNDPWFNFGYKSIPHVDNLKCPKAILDLLSDPEDEREANWRKECIEYAKRPKIADLPVGTMIRFTWWNGDVYTLEKMSPAHQFKRNWWYNAASNTYMPSRRIPSDFEVLE